MKTILALFIISNSLNLTAQQIEGDWYLEEHVLIGGDWEVPFFPDEQVPFVKASFVQYDPVENLNYLETSVCGNLKVAVHFSFSGDSFLVGEILEETGTECTNPQNSQFQEIYFEALSPDREFSFQTDDVAGELQRLTLYNEDYYMTFINQFMNAQDIKDQHSKIIIYPNPVKDILHFSEKLSEISIYDVSGKLILNQKTDSEQLNVANLPKGSYILKGKTQQGKQTNSKFIKQ